MTAPTYHQAGEEPQCAALNEVPQREPRLALEQGRIALLQPLVNGRVHRRQRP